MIIKSVLNFLLSLIPLRFLAVDCGVPVISNATVTTTMGTTYLDRGTFVCITGHEYNGTDSLLILCMANAKWSTPAGVCVGKVMNAYVFVCVHGKIV